MYRLEAWAGQRKGTKCFVKLPLNWVFPIILKYVFDALCEVKLTLRSQCWENFPRFTMFKVKGSQKSQRLNVVLLFPNTSTLFLLINTESLVLVYGLANPPPPSICILKVQYKTIYIALKKEIFWLGDGLQSNVEL